MRDGGHAAMVSRCGHCRHEDDMPIQTEELLQMLACPRCLGALEAVYRGGETAGFACPACAVVYPVRDDIPIMLEEEAIPRQRWDAEQS